MGTNEETTEVVETDVKSDEELVVEVVDNIDAVEEKAEEAELSEEIEEVEEKTDEADETEEKAESDDDVEEKADEAEETVEVADEVEEKTEDDEVEEKSEIDEALETLLVEEEDLQVKHLKSVGIDGERDEDEFLCGIERKMLKGDVCAHCRGGCVPEGEVKEFPGLLDIELKATEEYGEVIASGYEPNFDMFLLNVARKDGKVIEVAYDGRGEGLGWQLLNQDLVENKDALAGQKVISFDEAGEIANTELEGEVKSVEAAIFQGMDVYVVKIDSEEKSFDAYVRIDGEFLAYDEFYAEDAEVKTDMPDAPKPDKLASQVSAISDVDTLKGVLEAIGDDSDVVPDEVKAALIATAKKLDATEYLPKAWMDNEQDAPAEEPAEEEAEKKDVEVVVDGEKADDDFLKNLEAFESMVKENDSE